MHYVTNEQSAAVKILAIAGSLREQSYNRLLLEAVPELAPSWLEVSIYESLDEVPLFNEAVADSATPAGVLKLRHAFSEADGVLISLGEPEQGLEGRPVAVTGITTGPWGTRLAQTMLRQMLVSAQAILLPQPSLYLSHAESIFDDAGNLVDSKTRQRLCQLVVALGEWVTVLEGPSRSVDAVSRAPSIDAIAVGQ